MKKRSEQAVVFLLVAALGALVALNANRYFVRLDLSRNKAFTISQASRTLLREITDRVNITYFVSDKLRARYLFPGQVEDMLQEYAAYGKGRIAVTVVDPSREKKSAQAENLGVTPQQIQDVVKDEINVATVYSGVVIQYLDRYETIPLVSELSTLEFDLTSRIRRVVTQKEKVLGILIGDSRRTMDKDYALLGERLAEGFRLQELERGKDVPSDVSALFVLGNRDLEEADLFPVDQFLMRGGKALFAVDAVDVDLSYNLQATPVASDAFFEMLAAYGVRVPIELALDTVNQRITVNTGNNRMMTVRYPFWITVSEKNVDRTHPITSRFSGLDFYWASPLSPIERAGIQEDVLVRTSPDSWTMKDRFELNPALSATLAAEAAGTREKRALAIALRGQFQSFFRGRPIPARKGEKPAWTATVEKGPDTRILVLGDSDLASGMVQYTNASYNLTFLSNCAEWLSSDDDLLGIRTRTQADARLNRVQDPAAKARFMMASQVVNVVLVPLSVVCAGILRLLLRRRRGKGVQQ